MDIHEVVNSINIGPAKASGFIDINIDIDNTKVSLSPTSFYAISAATRHITVYPVTVYDLFG
jgi:hypothetical protein